MTDENVETSQEAPEEITPEQADDQLSAGFSKAMKSRDPSTPSVEREPESKEEEPEVQESPEQKPEEQEEKPDDQQEIPEAAEQEEPEPPKPSPDQRAISRKLRRLEGQFGALNGQIAELLKKTDSSESKSSAAKTQEQTNAALKNLSEIEEASGDFEFLKPVKAELESMHEQLGKISNAEPAPQQPMPDLDAWREEIKQEAILSAKHPDHTDVVNTQEFGSFMLSGGPTTEEFVEYKSLESTDEKEAEMILQEWKEDYPQWWKDRGQYAFSARAVDAIKLIDDFKTSQDKARQEQETKTRKSKRLEKAVDPQGVETAPPAEPGEDEQMSRGFKRVMSKRQTATP